MRKLDFEKQNTEKLSRLNSLSFATVVAVLRVPWHSGRTILDSSLGVKY